MNTFDGSIILFLHQFAFRSRMFDHAMIALSEFYMFRGLPLMALLWWVWFRNEKTVQRDREIVISTIMACLLSVLIGRLLAHYLPFRVRPFDNPEFNFPFPADEAGHPLLRTWSAFPSDHAMMWCAVATGIWLTSRWIGALALLYTLMFIGVPRVYLGLHYPTDVLAGAALGIALCLALNREPVARRLARPLLGWAAAHQGVFYAGVFLLSFELASQFDELRQLSQSLVKHL